MEELLGPSPVRMVYLHPHEVEAADEESLERKVPFVVVPTNVANWKNFGDWLFGLADVEAWLTQLPTGKWRWRSLQLQELDSETPLPEQLSFHFRHRGKVRKVVDLPPPMQHPLLSRAMQQQAIDCPHLMVEEKLRLYKALFIDKTCTDAKIMDLVASSWEMPSAQLARAVIQAISSLALGACMKSVWPASPTRKRWCLGELSGSDFSKRTALPSKIKDFRRHMAEPSKIFSSALDLASCSYPMAWLRWFSLRLSFKSMTTVENPIYGLRVHRQQRRQNRQEHDLEKTYYPLVSHIFEAAVQGQVELKFGRLAQAANSGEDLTGFVNGAARIACEVKPFILFHKSGGTETLDVNASTFSQLLDQVEVLCFPERTYRAICYFIWKQYLHICRLQYVEGKLSQMEIIPPLPSSEFCVQSLLELYDMSFVDRVDIPVAHALPVEPPGGFIALVNSTIWVCATYDVSPAKVTFQKSSGEELEVEVCSDLRVCGGSSLVLSARTNGQNLPSSVLKVASMEDTCHEVQFHVLVDGKSAFIREMLCEGVVKGAGPLGFIQLAGFGEPLKWQQVQDDEICKAYLEQACLAVDVLHATGILHCDIKPENFVVMRETAADVSTLVLNDFNLSCLSHEAQTGFVGTKAYISPRLNEERIYGELDDWLSLALSFLQLKGQYKSEDHKVHALRCIESAVWATKTLKEKVGSFLSE